MRFISSLLCAALSASAAFASSVDPGVELVSAGSFKLPVQHKGHKDGAAAVRQTYVKYGFNQSHPAFTAEAAVDAKAAGRVDSSPYLAVTVGGQTLNLSFDTGSADLWMFSTKLPPNQYAGRSAVFNPDASATFRMLEGYTFNITYGDQSSVAGVVGLDTVEVGGVTAKNQAVGLATDIVNGFATFAMDGIIGMAMTSNSAVKPKQQTPFIWNALSSLELPVFTCNIDITGVGYYGFGAIDTSAYIGNLSYVSVTANTQWWQFTMPGYAVGHNVTRFSESSISKSRSIIDTGSNLMYLPPDVISAYYASVPGAHESTYYGGWVFPVNAATADLGIMMGDNYMAVVRADSMCYSIQDNYCYGSAQSNNINELNILGQAFIQSQYVVFDAGNMQMGFAPQVGTGVAWSGGNLSQVSSCVATVTVTAYGPCTATIGAW